MIDGSYAKKITMHLVVYGRVQGVGFRESMRRKAENLRVSGWVKNRVDSAVEAAVHGDPDAVGAIVRWAHRGPEMATVERVEVEPAEGSYSDFDVIWW